ncbi:glycine zipper 2TM domain-containing protein [Advenella alkanexedens]|uniref:Glycine zipper 2TM domain-containing protein n=2 Tax=Advenella TaxID=290425 RepID=A0ABS6NM60_9BURK|nr:glycine zipper 2TM domain-containing protein [Advenella sp.]MBV4396693.1 glycine zipper 2TM domain-containing protein [Advenella alkanexedens]NLN66548.1 glycine zipper 2TM domain-containing protein [Alcaligenaceae bacterium]
MNLKSQSRIILIGLFSLAITGCAGYDRYGYNSNQRTTATVGGAALGGLAGAVVSEGDPLVTVGGAALGGLIGNQLYRDDDRSYRRSRDRDNRYYRRTYDNNRRYQNNRQYRDRRYWE